MSDVTTVQGAKFGLRVEGSACNKEAGDHVPGHAELQSCFWVP